MVGDGTLDIMTEIEALVSDKLQVVSYKWLSRNISVSSNDAKRLLQEFAEKHGSGLEVIYTLSGWLKINPPVYNIRLVSGSKLADVKKEFEDNYSTQVYSVQACIPKDPAALWSAEFVQTEELFNQPATVDNCLRDNRFCSVLNSFVKRNFNGSSVGVSPPQPKNTAVTVPSRSNIPFQAPTAPQPHQGKVQQEIPKNGQSSSVVGTDVKSGNNASGINVQAAKPFPNREKDTVLTANKKKVQNEKSSSGSGASLTSLWGQASAKAKPSYPPSTSEVIPSPIVTAEAQISAREAIDAVSSDDDDDQNVNHKRASNGQGNRKRRVVMDYSDEEDDYENAVNLASPDPPKQHSGPDSKLSTKVMVLEKNHLNFEEQKEDQLKIKQEKDTEKESSLPLKDAPLIASKSNSTGILLSKKNDSCIPVDGVNKMDTTTNATSNSPKRRKVLKTRIDERGREVTEVVWDGEETESKNNDKNTTTVTAENRPPAAKKSPALGSSAPSNPVSKAGSKKTGKGGGVKDAKQGNILSFFKKLSSNVIQVLVISWPVIVLLEKEMSRSNNNRFNSRNWSQGSNLRGHIANYSRPPQAPRPSPYGHGPGFPAETSFRTRIIVLPGEMAHAVNPRIRQFIQEFPPMITTDQWPMQLPPPQENESILTQEEQNKALKKLKKIVYNPLTKNKTRKWCLYYRDNTGNISNSKEEENDEDGKACVICLEDFVPNHEVLVSPCNHMFHEDCIIPWAKSQGRCPICRAALSEPRRENNMSSNNNNYYDNTNVMANDIAEDNLISLLRAMEERMTFPHF